MLRVSKWCGALALAASLIAVPTASYAGVFVGIDIGIGASVNVAPPPLPVYVQPPCVVADTIWAPGYWAYGPYGYYWVPGTWVAAPQIGYLWTPGYWGYRGGAYAWHAGYWGPHVGFYGGVNYGFGYSGAGYAGGGWSGNHFSYNTAVTNITQTTITNVYVNKTVINNDYNSNIARVSYNGGPGGIERQPTADEMAAERSEPHVPMTAAQRQHSDTAALNRNFLASVNHGAPPTAAFAAPLSRENLPENFAAPTSADRRAAAIETSSSSHPAPSRDANLAQPSYATREPRSALNASRNPDELDASSATASHHTVTTMHEPASYAAPGEYRAPRAYHALGAPHAPSTNRESTSRAPRESHSTHTAPQPAPAHPREHEQEH